MSVPDKGIVEAARVVMVFVIAATFEILLRGSLIAKVVTVIFWVYLFDLFIHIKKERGRNNAQDS